MKAVLVIDMPDKGYWDCNECPCFHEDREVCQAGAFFYGGKKHCPLKPMPKRREYIGIEHRKYAVGWNACIDEILGEEE